MVVRSTAKFNKSLGNALLLVYHHMLFNYSERIALLRGSLSFLIAAILMAIPITRWHKLVFLARNSLGHYFLYHGAAHIFLSDFSSLLHYNIGSSSKFLTFKPLFYRTYIFFTWFLRVLLPVHSRFSPVSFFFSYRDSA